MNIYKIICAEIYNCLSLFFLYVFSWIDFTLLQVKFRMHICTLHVQNKIPSYKYANTHFFFLRIIEIIPFMYVYKIIAKYLKYMHTLFDFFSIDLYKKSYLGLHTHLVQSIMGIYTCIYIYLLSIYLSIYLYLSI